MRIQTVVLIWLVTAACGGNKSEPGYNGHVAFNAKTNVHLASATGGAPLVCGHFVLQPVSIDAAGHETPAGSPVSIDSTAAAQTDAILGCIDDGNTASPNWGYQVTASGWIDCTTGAAIANATPATAFSNATVSCTKSQDVTLNITVDVSIPVANSAGYIDVSVGVSSTEVQTGCKNADYAADGTTLHFGESNIDPNGEILQGLIGIDDGAPQQWAGTVNAGASPGLDTFYTGQLDTSQPGTSLVYQTFVPACAGNEQYVGPRQAQCITTIARGREGGSAPSTAASLADAFIESQDGFAAATIESPTVIQIVSNNFNAAPLFSDASAPGTTNFNTGTSLTTVTATTGSFTSVVADRSGYDQFLVTGLSQDGTPAFAALTVNGAGTGWEVGGWFALASMNAAQQACSGIFGSAAPGCMTPQRCWQGEIGRGGGIFPTCLSPLCFKGRPCPPLTVATCQARGLTACSNGSCCTACPLP